MRTAKFLVLALATCSVIGLAQRVRVNPATAVDFSKFKTFSIRNASVTNTIFWLSNDTVQHWLESDIRKYLEAKGLAFVSSGPSDLDVDYHFGTGERAGSTVVGVSEMRFHVLHARMRIELFDASAGHRVPLLPLDRLSRDSGDPAAIWDATSGWRLAPNDMPKLESQLDHVVKESFEGYPPRSK